MSGFTLNADPKDVEEFGNTNCFVEELLTTLDESFAIVLSLEDYYVAAGPRGFIEILCGGDINSAIADFRQFAGWPGTSAEESEELFKLGERFTQVQLT